MSQDGEITEREREVLALLLQGHETKSIAATLGISVHAVNERLRDARRKLGASSSREAARRYFQGDDAAVQISRDRKIGLGGAGSEGVSVAQPMTGLTQNRVILLVLGVAVMLSILALATALSSAGQAPKSAEPVVAATSPGAGAAISPGPFVLSVTFDRPMMANHYSFVQVTADSFPKCEKSVEQSADHRTFSMRCTAEAGRRYEVWFNSPPYTAFRDEQGVIAPPHRLLFAARK